MTDLQDLDETFAVGVNFLPDMRFNRRGPKVAVKSKQTEKRRLASLAKTWAVKHIKQSKNNAR